MSDVVKKLAITTIIVLVVVAIVLTSLAVVKQYSVILRDGASADNVSTTLLNGSWVDVGTSGQYPYLQTATGCVNASNGSLSLSTTDYQVREGDETGGDIFLTNSTWNNTAVNCSITYKADTNAQGTADNFVTGIGYYGTFIGIVILSIIGAAIVGIFRKE